MADITIAICTFNGESRLPKVLEHLRDQIGIEDIECEILVVDNASRDNTQEVVKDYQKKWEAKSSLRYAFESKQGAAFARRRAAIEAKGELVAFVDDDNLLMPNWIEAAYRFAQAHPKAGAFGGQIHGRFEVEPPEDFKQIQIFLAIVERGPKPYQYERTKRMLPPGAGLVVRKQAWQDHLPDRTVLTGRTNDSLMAGEDIECVAHIQNAGWELWYNPEMELDHVIPKKRLEQDYLLRLAWSTGLCRHYIRMARYSLIKGIFLTPLHIINDAHKLLSYFFRGQFKVKNELLRKVEINHRLGTFTSPFHFLFYRLSDRRNF